MRSASPARNERFAARNAQLANAQLHEQAREPHDFLEAQALRGL